ncbi:MAG: hypothetical protein P8N50_02695 [Actinomycetota bacterium]|jgi:hypothetical protein|nr:hypothetical protein [Actinomycetota bacterium]
MFNDAERYRLSGSDVSEPSARGRVVFVQNTLRIVGTVAIGLVIGRFSGLVFVLLIMTGGLLTGLVLRVMAQERSTGASQTARIAIALGIAVLAGRLIGWFGIIGGFLALILIGVALVLAGAGIT